MSDDSRDPGHLDKFVIGKGRSVGWDRMRGHKPPDNRLRWVHSHTPGPIESRRLSDFAHIVGTRPILHEVPHSPSKSSHECIPGLDMYSHFATNPINMFAYCEYVRSCIQRVVRMHIISKKSLSEFWKKHLDVETPLRAWYSVAKTARWLKLVNV